MAWTKKTINGVFTESEVLGTAGTVAHGTGAFSSVIKDIKTGRPGSTRYLTVQGTATNATTNVAWHLYGGDSITPSAHALLVTLFTQTTPNALTTSASVDLSAYPAPYYSVKCVPVASTNGTVVSVKIFADAAGSL